MQHTPYPQGAVLVTGASSGIGEACALHLAARGFLVFAGVRTQESAGSLRRRASPQLQPVMLDVTDIDSISGAAQTIAEELQAAGLPGLAGVVNNAGIAVGGPLEALPISMLRHQLEVNVVGQVAVTQAMLPHLRRSSGRIVMIGSFSGRVATPFVGAYCASKFALEAITASLRMELSKWQLPVVMIEPGAIGTPIWEKSLAAGDELERSLDDDLRRRYSQELTMVRKYVSRTVRRALSADEVAEVVVRALTTRRPRKRYIVGRDTRLVELLRLLPDGLREALILTFARL